jgi:EmrB/QacA subfamily drug resistance transporter
MEQPTVNRRILLIVTVISAFFNPFMGAAVNLALPDIIKEFSMTAVSVGWVAMSFLLSSAVFLVPLGKLADIFGRKKSFLWGSIIFWLSSLGCGLSVSGTMLIAFRLLQGFGSAMVLSSNMAILTSVYPPHERGRVIGINVAAVYIGLSAAPVLGGYMTHVLGWRSLFYINVIAGMLVSLGIFTKIKAEWADARHEKFDIWGSVVYMLAVSTLMYGFSKLPESFAIALVALGLVGLFVFIRIELKVASPVLDMQLFSQNRIFAFSNLAALINYAATFGVTFILSLYLPYIKGLPPQKTGSILIAQPLVMALLAGVAGKLSDKIDSRILSSIGMSLVVVGLFLLIFLDAASGFPYLIMCLIILGLGFGFFSSPNTNAIMSSVEKRYLGTASATLGTMRLTGQMLSMAIATMILHIMIGENKIQPSNYPALIHSMHLIFIIFTALCFLGIFASLARGKKTVN